MTLFDYAEAARRRDEAIARVEANADEDYSTAVARALRIVAARQDTFTMDDVMQLVAARSPHVTTHEPRVNGAIVRAALRDGIMQSTGHYRPSTQAQAHARPMPVYESLIR